MNTMAKKLLSPEEIAILQNNPFVASASAKAVTFTPEFKRMAYGRLTSSVSTEEIVKWLFPLGWTYPGFYSADYFPLFPWFFVFLVGSWAGYYVAERKLPERFYELKGVPFFSWLGRRSLFIYVIHQPILYGLVMLILLISGK